MLHISYRTGLKLAKNGSLPVFKVGNQWRIKAADLDQYIRQSKRQPSIGEHKVYFNLRVLNRYRDNPKYFFEESDLEGRFGLKAEFIHQGKDYDFVFEKIADVRFQKMPLKGGAMAVCLDSEYYAKTVAGVPDEYSHWHNYRIHYPNLP